MSMKKTAILVALLFAACSREQAHRAKQSVQQKVEKVQDAFDVSAPMGKPDPKDVAQQRERERFDQRWRQLQSFREQQARAAAQQQAQAAAAAAAEPKITFVTGGKETFKGLDAGAINAAP